MKQKPSLCVSSWCTHISNSLQSLGRSHSKTQRRRTEWRGNQNNEFDQRNGMPFMEGKLYAVILENKWLRGNMIEVYKMMSSTEIVNRQWFFIICHYSRHKRYKMKLWASSSKQPRRRAFSSQLIIKSYSSLPQHDASAKSINFYKRN